MGSITHRERIMRAVGREEADRVPVDFAGSFASTITLGGYEKLKAHLGVKGETEVLSERSQLAVVAEEILQRFDIDTRMLIHGSPERAAIERFPDGSYRDEWGVVRSRPHGGHYYVSGPTFPGELTAREVERFEWPDPHDPGYTRGIAEKAQDLRENTDYAVLLNLPVGFIHQSQFMRGFDRWMMDFVECPEVVEALMDRVLDLWLTICGDLMDAAEGRFDLVFYGDDVAHQGGSFLSPEMYRQYLKPRQRRLIEFVREWTSAPIVYHSCGAVASLLPDLVDIGIDVLNPVQVAAEGMDSRRLKQEFGHVLAFWGAIDTQKVLPFGTVEDVRAEVRRRINDLGRGGGYVVNSVHNIQPDVPPENICAMFDAAREFSAA